MSYIYIKAVVVQQVCKTRGSTLHIRNIEARLLSLVRWAGYLVRVSRTKWHVRIAQCSREWQNCMYQQQRFGQSDQRSVSLLSQRCE